MKLNDVLTLLNAGYTREEILAMETDPGAASDTPDHSHPSSVDPIPSSQPAEAVSSSPAVEQEEPAAAPDPTEQLLSKLTELVQAMQANNRGSAEIRGNIIEPGAQALDTLRILGGIPSPTK